MGRQNYFQNSENQSKAVELGVAAWRAKHPAGMRPPSSQAIRESFDFAGGVTVSGSDNPTATCESFSLFTSKQTWETQGQQQPERSVA